MIRLVSELFEGPNLALTFEVGNVNAMQLHELLRERVGFLSRLGFDDRVTADDFF